MGVTLSLLSYILFNCSVSTENGSSETSRLRNIQESKSDEPNLWNLKIILHKEMSYESKMALKQAQAFGEPFRVKMCVFNVFNKTCQIML
jgi:hypothetical protein